MGVFSCEKRIFCVREGPKNLAVSAPKRRLVQAGRAQKKCGNAGYCKFHARKIAGEARALIALEDYRDQDVPTHRAGAMDLLGEFYMVP